MCTYIYLCVSAWAGTGAILSQRSEQTLAGTGIKWCLFHYRLNEWGRREDGGFIRLSLSGARPGLAGWISVWYKAKTATFQLPRARLALQSASLAQRIRQKKEKRTNILIDSQPRAGPVPFFFFFYANLEAALCCPVTGRPAHRKHVLQTVTERTFKHRARNHAHGAVCRSERKPEALFWCIRLLPGFKPLTL